MEGQGFSTFAATAMQREVSRPLLPMRVVIIPNLHEETKFLRSSTFSLSSGSLLLAALYGSAGLPPGTSALLKVEDILDSCADFRI